MSIVTKFDFLSGPIHLKIRGESKAKSVCGGIISILFFFACLTLLVLLGKELFERRNPIISNSELQTEENRIYLKDFPIAFYLTGSRGEDITQKLFDFDLIRATMYTTNSGGETINLKDLFFSECSKELIDKHFSTISTIKRTTYCINPRKATEFGTRRIVEDELYFSKGFLAASSESLVITISRGNNFIPEQELFYFGLVTVQNIVDERDFSNPVKSALLTTNKQFDLNSQLKLNPEVQVNRLVTDKGWIVSETEEIVFSSMTVAEVAKPVKGGERDELVRIEFSSSGTKREKFREYLKIPGLLANLGGIIRVLQFFCVGILKIYSEFVVFDYVWSLKKEELKVNVTETRDKNNETLSLVEFLRWKVLFSKPSARLALINNCLEVDNILDKQSKSEKTEISRFKVNVSSNNLVKS